MALEMAFTFISMLEVVTSTAPDPSATTPPFIWIVKAQPDLTPLLTEPSVKMMASSSELDQLFHSLVSFTRIPLSALTPKRRNNMGEFLLIIINILPSATPPDALHR